MALFFTATLLVSILGICFVVYIKHWELTSGRIFLGSLRPPIDRFFHVILFWVERVLPALARLYGRHIVRTALHYLHRVAALAVLHMEHALERTLHALRHTTDVQRLPGQGSVGQASAFLREVAEHKKKLLHAQHARMHLHKE